MSATASNQPQTKRPLSPHQVVEALRLEAARSPVFRDTCHIFAIRERARQQVTLANLRLSMHREGFFYSREEFEAVLKFLASAGLGTLATDSSGRVRSLDNIRMTLQSVGLAAIKQSDTLAKFEPAVEFKELPVVAQASVKDMPQTPQTPHTPEAPQIQIQKPDKLYPAVIVINVDGQAVTVELPKKLALKEVARLLNELSK